MSTDIGARNIDFVRQYVQDEGFNVVGEDLGDIYPRKVVYFPDTGKIRVKRFWRRRTSRWRSASATTSTSWTANRSQATSSCSDGLGAFWANPMERQTLAAASACTLHMEGPSGSIPSSIVRSQTDK